VALPQRDRDLGHAHRHARMPGLRSFDRVHRQRADRVGCSVRVGVSLSIMAMAAARWRDFPRAAWKEKAVDREFGGAISATNSTASTNT
jgi:ribosomal protein L34E